MAPVRGEPPINSFAGIGAASRWRRGDSRASRRTAWAALLLAILVFGCALVTASTATAQEQASSPFYDQASDLSATSQPTAWTAQGYGEAAAHWFDGRQTSGPFVDQPIAAEDDGWVVVDDEYDDLTFAPAGPVEPWTWKLLPDSLLYRAYLAGAKESRFASFWAHTRDQGWLWEITLGGRAGIVRYGTWDEVDPEGIQLDIEGATQPRLDLEEEHDMVAADFRFGVPLTYRRGPWQTKLAFYHLSAHLGDEFLLKNPSVERINYSRDVMMLGLGYFVTPDLRIYGEAGWAWYSDGGSDPWEFQFGFDYAPALPTGFRGAPFLAVNGHLRQEVEYGGNLVVQTGWAWRSHGPGRLFRFGVEYFNGKSRQFEFFDRFEEQIGLGLWFDY